MAGMCYLAGHVRLELWFMDWSKNTEGVKQAVECYSEQDPSFAEISDCRLLKVCKFMIHCLLMFQGMIKAVETKDEDSFNCELQWYDSRSKGEGIDCNLN